MSWQVVYGDRTVYTGSPWYAPATNVQAIVVPSREHGWELVYGGAGLYGYIPEQDTWRNFDSEGDLHVNYLCLPGPRKVVFGRTLADDEWQDMYRWLTREVGPKTGWTPTERLAVG